MATTTPPTIPIASTPIPSTLTTIPTSLASILTNSTTTSTSPSSLPTSSDPDGPDDPDDPLTADSHIIYSYFFILLAAAVLIVLLSILGYTKRRRARKARERSQGQSALARDVDGFHGGSGGGAGAGAGAGDGGRSLFADRGAYLRSVAGRLRRGPAAAVREDGEGLNELGEAPPAYKARDMDVEAEAEIGENRGEEISVPLRTLDRQTAGLPKYDDVVKETNSAGSLPAIGNTSR